MKTFYLCTEDLAQETAKRIDERLFSTFQPAVSVIFSWLPRRQGALVAPTLAAWGARARGHGAMEKFCFIVISVCFAPGVRRARYGVEYFGCSACGGAAATYIQSMPRGVGGHGPDGPGGRMHRVGAKTCRGCLERILLPTLGSSAELLGRWLLLRRCPQDMVRSRSSYLHACHHSFKFTMHTTTHPGGTWPAATGTSSCARTQSTQIKSLVLAARALARAVRVRGAALAESTATAASAPSVAPLLCCRESTAGATAGSCRR